MKSVTLAAWHDDEVRKRSSRYVEQFRASGLSQMEYCRQSGIVLSSLGRYLRRVKSPEQQLVRVKIESPPDPGYGFCADARQRPAHRQ